MEVCFSWDHARIAWEAYENEPCPLCHALKLSDAKDKAIERLKIELADAEFKLKALKAIA